MSHSLAGRVGFWRQGQIQGTTEENAGLGTASL